MIWDSDFEQKVILIVIDKGVMALILLFAGIFANYLLEKFKSEQSLDAELSKLRVNKIGECFGIHSKYGKLLNGFIDALNEYRNSTMNDEQIIEKLSPKIKELKESKKEVELITASHRFWLGDEIYEEALRFNKTFPNFCDVFHKGNFKRCVELKMNMEKEMLDVDEVMRMIRRKIKKSKKGK
ncbi:hypothetical protein [Algoriphagus antarcticus]|uniref:Uncharacterized protein n=1 Tax=Algoriphagus antarcticus TaxID=238540 RepID=A0A3E0DA59_9BACT|nr:hypothetical protein [Algoriphagus antarcticus]REG79566.1 hypothetical protein C8N25_1303 [Algoriphagus antarcticus]